MNVIKRNGTEVSYNNGKISNAMRKAFDEVSDTYPIQNSDEIIRRITDRLYSKYLSLGKAVSVESIQDDVEIELMKEGAYHVAQAYVRYRHEHEMRRRGNSIDGRILSIVDGNNEEVIQENSNKNPIINSTQRDYMAGEISRDLTNRILLPPDIVQADKDGVIHFHDGDYYAQRMHNCCLVNLEDMLQNGTVISGTKIEKPHSFSTACNVATQIVAQVASNQYGGQSITLSHLSPFVDVSRQKFKQQVAEEFRVIKGRDPETEEEVEACNAVVNSRLRDEIKKGVQTIQYQVITLMTTNGQAPFITVFMYLNEVEDGQAKEDLAMVIEEVVKQRLEGVKNEDGVWITPAFPKLIYCLEEDNITEDSKYWYLTELCAKCSTKRLVPDYISEKVMLKNKIDENGNGNVYTPMGCRSFLTPYVDENGKPKYYGRFNQGVVTINLPDVGLTARSVVENNPELDIFEVFWNVFEERLELCHKALRLRHERLRGTLSDASPIHWQHGALARLKKGETIDKLLYGGYSTLSLGYAGLYECVKAITGESHTSENGKGFAIAVMQKMNDKCMEWRNAENIHYSLYGTPIESTTYKFAKSLRKRFGVIEGITDKDYITNSYHVHVTEEISAFDKLKFESEFQLLSPGGAISYIESANLEDNVEAALEVMKYIYENIIYAEINTKSDYCQVCGYDGEIKIVEDENGKLVWECPKCGSRDRNRMNIARRTCGYIGTNDFNQGRTQEIKERYVHLGGE